MRIKISPMGKKIGIKDMKFQVPYMEHPKYLSRHFDPKSFFIPINNNLILIFEPVVESGYPFGHVLNMNNYLIENLIFIEIKSTIQIILDYEPNKGES